MPKNKLDETILDFLKNNSQKPEKSLERKDKQKFLHILKNHQYQTYLKEIFSTKNISESLYWNKLLETSKKKFPYNDLLSLKKNISKGYQVNLNKEEIQNKTDLLFCYFI